MYRWLVLGVLWATGCVPGPGPCDQNAALELVYTADGTPSFAGQAVMQASCGNGGFCHSDSNIPLEDRFGAPVDLGFDMRIASTSAAPNEEETVRLISHQQRVLGMAGDIRAQVESARMPPPGDARADYVCQILPSTCAGDGEDLTFDRYADDGITSTPLPTLLDDDAARRDEAAEIMRNWIACGAPVVERTERREDRLPTDNFLVANCERNCVDVRWPAIYAGIIQPSCASSRCHDADDPAGNLDMSDGAAAVHGRIVGRTADGTQCRPGGQTIVVPSDPDASLLLLKLEAASSDEVCGSRMPLSGNPLSAQRLCAIREWIACGACAEADGGACTACLDAARATCNVDPGAETGCITTSPCDNHAEL